MIICGIYKYTSPSGKTYIGSSKNIYKRIKILKEGRKSLGELALAKSEA